MTKKAGLQMNKKVDVYRERVYGDWIEKTFVEEGIYLKPDEGSQYGAGSTLSGPSLL